MCDWPTPTQACFSIRNLDDSVTQKVLLNFLFKIAERASACLNSDDLPLKISSR